MSRHSSGFTLIELIIVIVVLGILAVTAAPRFIDMSDDAQAAKMKAAAAAFKSGVTLVHSAWLIRANGAAVQDFIEIEDDYVGGHLSVNEFGYPIHKTTTQTTIASSSSCAIMWRAILTGEDLTVMTNGSNMIQSLLYQTENSSPGCRYALVENRDLFIEYDTHTGEVTFFNNM